MIALLLIVTCSLHTCSVLLCYYLSYFFFSYYQESFEIDLNFLIDSILYESTLWYFTHYVSDSYSKRKQRKERTSPWMDDFVFLDSLIIFWEASYLNWLFFKTYHWKHFCPKTKISSFSFISLKFPIMQMVSLYWRQKYSFLCKLLFVINACLSHYFIFFFLGRVTSILFLYCVC